MPQSDFSSRAATSGRPKVFLADLEYVKKEELERRRKLRLKQVRQQARDIASLIRNQASLAKKKKEEQNKADVSESAAKSTENRRVELQQKLSECLTSVGAGHSSAAMMTEVDELLQHKIELQDTLARVRAELAAEKAKETRKPRQDVSSCIREGITISKLRSVKPSTRIPNVRKLSPTGTSASTTTPATPPNLIRTTAVQMNSEGPPGDQDSAQIPSVKTIFSPPMLARKRSEKPRKFDRSPTDGRKSCPPSTETTEFLDSSADSDDSGQTWPPVSVRKKKNFKVRMYDHSAKKCSEYVQQQGVIRMDTPPTSNMKELIREEEELISRKAEELNESRQLELERGLKAIREEMAKQNFDTAIRDLCQNNKERRFRKAHMYQPPAVSEPSQSDERRDNGHKTSNLNQEKPQDGQLSQHRPPVTVSQPLQSIVSKLAEQREAILQAHESSHSSDDSAGTTEESEDGGNRLPLWIQTEFNAQNNVGKDVPDRVATPNTLMSNMNNQKGASDVESKNMSSDLSSFIRHEQELEASESTNVSPKQETANRQRKSQGDPRPNKSQDDRSSSNGTVSGSSSSPGMKVHNANIKKDKTPVKRLSFQTPNKETETSTSYYSPPERLSPQQISVLNDILSKISVKNRNPVLHHYITRMLEMSRQSLSDLEVSGCSDVSVPSEVMCQAKISIPIHHSRQSQNCNGVTSKQQVNLGRNRVCLKELDNLSTAGTVSSSPRTDSIENIPPPNHSVKIAELLRNIINLHRLYNIHASADPSAHSDSNSSYQSVPGGIDANHYYDVAPPAGNGLNYCEDTGIFVSHNTSRDANHPTLTSLLNGQYFNIPSQLHPNPFAEPGGETGDVGRPSTFPGLNMLEDVPDSRRPGRDPSSIYISRRDPNKVINSLSDIESAVSSIQNTPTKKSTRASSPARSHPTDDRTSTLSDISSREFIGSQEMLNNDLINSTSSSSDFEDVFQSLGLGWALSTLRRTRTSKNLRAEDSSSKSGSLQSSERTKTGTGYHHSTPLKNSNSTASQKSLECDPVPALTPPNMALHCPNLQK
ncbi:hypothetical protein GE061_012508 [Apolygus lucorum]|uniref:Uncharacterized protein n=1 Tax=Apolygus lucorum TaxID=248454 RepID=A0A8S9XUK7_APOLU|nr:hypothetical protein GE061_012508 [Apolygus lucorum]